MRLVKKEKEFPIMHIYFFFYNYSNHSLFDRMVIIQYLNSSFLLYSTMSNLERETSLIQINKASQNDQLIQKMQKSITQSISSIPRVHSFPILRVKGKM
jgi:hypothetical protein